MESLPKNPMLEFNPTTLSDVRKEYNLDKPGRMDEAIDILEDWVKKQPHFVKKDFSREYLEILLISAKGLIERAKTRLDRLCTFKTLLPKFFEIDNAKTEFLELRKFFTHARLPKLTKNHCRVYLYRVDSVDYDSSLMSTYYKYQVFVAEYTRKFEYTAGHIVVIDLSAVNIMSYITKLNFVELRQSSTLFREGYGGRVKVLHIITTSKMIDRFVSICKQVFSEKIANRIHIHETVETLYQYVEKEILPKEYGGMERSLEELNDDWFNMMTSEEHMNYMEIMKEAKTNESCRQKDKFNEDYVGMPGSFRSLSVD